MEVDRMPEELRSLCQCGHPFEPDHLAPGTECAHSGAPDGCGCVRFDAAPSLLPDAPRREDNPRLVSRQSWWIAYGQWMTDGSQGPICTECADPMPDGAFVGALVCNECAPYVPESERVF